MLAVANVTKQLDRADSLNSNRNRKLWQSD